MKSKIGLVCFCFMCHISSVWASDIQCTVQSYEQEFQIDISPTEDVFQYNTINIVNGYRFTVQWLKTNDKIKTYVYYFLKTKHVLISQQEFNLNQTSCGLPFGKSTVYAGNHERELNFVCTKSC